MLTRRAFLRPDRPAGDVLVCVFLRGGADGLNMVIPAGDPEYSKLRPLLAVRKPIALDGTFGLHPSLAPLAELYRAGRLAVVHAVGSDDQTRSHFEAQDLMEHGNGSGGWLGRALRQRSTSALSAVAIAPAVPEALRGTGAAAMESIDDFKASDETALATLYGERDDAVSRAGRETLSVLRTVQRLRAEPYAAYPDSDFARGLREAARLIKADVGVEVACVDLGGWDTHFVQAGLHESQMEELAAGLRAFHDDLGDRRVTTVVMTEFGRRAYENASLGTDHGRAGVMFLMGGGVIGGRVHGRWPGLTDLEEPGDLKVTTDYRSVLAEVLERRCGVTGNVFPGFTPSPLGLTR